MRPRHGRAAGEDAALCNGRIKPGELDGRKVVVFASHEHSDHLDPVIFTWRDKVPGIACELIARVSGTLPGTQMVAASLPGDHVIVCKGRVVAASTGGTAPVTVAGAACAVPRDPAGCAGQ